MLFGYQAADAVTTAPEWWFGERVLISPLAVKAIDWFDRHVELNISRELVKTSPPWDRRVQ